MFYLTKSIHRQPSHSHESFHVHFNEAYLSIIASDRILNTPSRSRSRSHSHPDSHCLIVMNTSLPLCTECTRWCSTVFVLFVTCISIGFQEHVRVYCIVNNSKTNATNVSMQRILKCAKLKKVWINLKIADKVDWKPFVFVRCHLIAIRSQIQ